MAGHPRKLGWSMLVLSLLQPEEADFDVKRTGESSDSAVFGNDPVTRNDDRDWVPSAGRTHGLEAFGADGLCQISIASGFPIGDGMDGFPDAFLETCSLQRERKIKDFPLLL